MALVKKQRNNPTAFVVVLPCGMWSCPECGQVNKSRWSHRIMKGVSHYQRRGHEFSFVTLTLRGDTRQRMRSIETWRKVFPRIIERHRRKVGTVPYAVIPELHKNGVVHLHSLIASQLPSRWWKDTSFHCGAGYMAKSIPVADHKATVGYVTKYLGKGIDLVKWPKGYRRIRVTHDWPREQKRPSTDNAVYEIYHGADVDYVVAKLKRLGYIVSAGFHQNAPTY